MARFNLYDEEFFPSPWQHTWRTFKQSHIAMTGLILLIFFSLTAVIGPFLAPYDPVEQNTNSLLVPPAWFDSGTIAHLFGTDAVGRDMLSRVIYGCQVTFGISILLVIIAMIVGVSLGAVAGMTKGVRSSILNHLLDSLMAIPTLLIAIVIVAMLGTGLVNSMWAITLALIPQFVHGTRDFVRDEMKKEYVLAARLDGAGKSFLFFQSILPNMIELLVVQATFALSTALLDITALGFLGLGAQPPLPELGVMLSAGLEVAYIAPWNLAIPGICIFLMVLAVNLVGDGLRSAVRKRMSS
ncbi:ABC transporter permease subunit [Aestuariibacter salexigens]|uniref:ABC transporter permease subunit n=1 Tax=Aestuariibacter salexigens TaxID=226010 RepID=UPI000429B931|nr:ABC transporter permease subunit [Aestuariibacter salexigens]